ncbi:nitrilase [Ferrimonas sediminum]|uniref:Nitrilase n=1 Tax=Ferrimonas sediminum TaxID=718193 RepID=A0A1G8Y8W3_9GAMM|nr:carbon-nitrogen hydrolase family protein [Ferrimonas sediminum]SDJ99216.1 nitrilase [Ferrimonas sediminum]
MEITVAISQKPPVVLDLEASLQRALAIIEEAAEQGARLLVFPEAYLPGYPTWVWRLRPGGDMALGNEIHSRLRQNAVDIDSGGLDAICDAAATHQLVVVMGLNEVDRAYSGSTLFNTVVVIDADGTIVNRHRKLMPTNPERMVWGCGDASGLRVVETAVGRIGCLICWESYMPLARFALYGQNIDLYVAPTWDCGEAWLASMKHIAREGGCWVLSTATAMEGSDLPDDFPGREQLFSSDEWINGGGAVVVKPSGAVAAGPMLNEKAILYTRIDTGAAAEARKSLDVSGHYHRPDLFSLQVDRRPMPPLGFIEPED